MKTRRQLGILTLVLLGVIPTVDCQADERPEGGSVALGSNMVQCLPLNSTKPLFLPTHPRVATTLRFPGPIGAPEGRGFTEDESKHPGEYLVTWTPGESHLTVTPLPGAGPLNLNIPYEGDIYVAYFYPVEKQVAAVTCVKLQPADARTGLLASPVTNPTPSQTQAFPGGKLTPKEDSQANAASPSQLEGLLDKLKLLCTCGDPTQLRELSKRLGLQVAIPPAMASIAPRGTSGPGSPGLEERRSMGGLDLRVRLVVRNDSLNALGFVFLLHNPGPRVCALDVSSFSIRAGELLLGQALGDAPAILMPGEEKPAFILFQCPAQSPLRLDNDWKASVDLLPSEEQIQPLALGEGRQRP